MKHDRLFKSLFWIITALMIGLIGTMMIFVIPLMMTDPEVPPFFPFFFGGMFLLIGVIYFSIGLFVYRDAPKRGVNRWMWMLIALYVPNLIGLIIYVIVTGNRKHTCVHCGKTVKEEYKACPYCGKDLESSCPNCQQSVKEEWHVCPYCKTNVKKGRE